jgi:hypothetical protein
MLFYGVYIKEIQASGALDLLRFICEPNYVRRSHITVRGPYKTRRESDIESFNSKEAISSFAIVDSLGSFFDGSQNTVLLKCRIDGVEKIWNKPDYPDSFPHLTIYDGSSREFAISLRYTLKQFKWKLKFKIGELELIEKKFDPIEKLGTHADNISLVYRYLFTNNFEVNYIKSMNYIDRLSMAVRVCRYLHDNYKN